MKLKQQWLIRRAYDRSLGGMAKPAKKSGTHAYTVLFEPMRDGGYNVVIPAIPEICTFGSTFAEAKRMALDAIQCYLEGLAKDQRSAPRDLRRTPKIARLSVKFRAA